MYKKVINEIKTLLNVEVNLEEMKTERGVIVYADEFVPGNPVYVLNDEGERMKAPEGEIPLEGGQYLVVDAEGLIVSIGEPSMEEEQEEEQEMKTEAPAKKVVESVTKETHFEKEAEKVEEKVEEVFFNDVAKQEIKDIVLAVLEAQKEVKEEVKEEELSKVEPLKHSPEKESKDFKFNFQSNRPNRQQKINKFLFG